jgi:hypothetical protein
LHVLWTSIQFGLHPGAMIIVDIVIFEFNSDRKGNCIKKNDEFGWKLKGERYNVNHLTPSGLGDEGRVGRCRKDANELWDDICTDGGDWYHTCDLITKNC